VRFLQIRGGAEKNQRAMTTLDGGVVGRYRRETYVALLILMILRLTRCEMKNKDWRLEVGGGRLKMCCCSLSGGGVKGEEEKM
jgi:hypothetical protein